MWSHFFENYQKKKSSTKQTQSLWLVRRFELSFYSYTILNDALIQAPTKLWRIWIWTARVCVCVCAWSVSASIYPSSLMCRLTITQLLIDMCDKTIGPRDNNSNNQTTHSKAITNRRAFETYKNWHDPNNFVSNGSIQANLAMYVLWEWYLFRTTWPTATTTTTEEKKTAFKS